MDWRRIMVATAAVLALVPALPAVAQPPDGPPPPVPPGAAARPDPVPVDGPREVPPEERDRVLGSEWRTSEDRAWTLSGDGGGLHLLVAERSSGYAWRDVATLAEPGVDTDRWIGNGCVLEDGTTAVVAYAPRQFADEEALFGRGAFTAVVDLVDGAVSRLPVTSSLAYFNPSCGGATAVLTQDGGADVGATRLVILDPATSATRTVEVPGQVTSAVPTANGLVAAVSGAVVRVDEGGSLVSIARADGVPFSLSADAEGGVVFLDRRDAVATVRRIDGAAVRSPQADLVPAPLASGALDRLGLERDAAGQVYLTGETTAVGALPPVVGRLAAPAGAEVSTAGEAVLTEVQAASLPAPSAANDPTELARPVSVDLTATDTGQSRTFVVPTASSDDGVPSEDGAPGADEGSTAITGSGGSPSDPVEAERTCSVPRNDPGNQVMQPKPRQVEWAVDQAVMGVLNVERRADWKDLGMPAYTPQGLFPPVPLVGGGRVPAQVMLGIIAQESNMWQAPGSVVPGVTGNPLVGNYYGREVYDDSPDDDWRINWDEADCGYGVAQVTDGMRLASRTPINQTALPYDSQRAVALDFAANVAAGLRILQQKWNETRSAGLTINDGNPNRIENWFYAVWAYNSGFHPQSQAADHNGAWGIGWFNNPANPAYPPGRQPFLELTYADAAEPQRWPYPEKIMGWAGHPPQLLEGPSTLVSGFRPAYWNGDGMAAVANRVAVKPPLNAFCDTSNSCNRGDSTSPTGPCGHRDAAGRFDSKCWYNRPVTWKPNCQASCGNELLRFDPGYPYQTDALSYPPRCDTDGLPATALVVDDLPTGSPSVRDSDCRDRLTNSGSFALDFATDEAGDFPSKVDFHQLGAGFGGHFWYAHTRTPELRGGSMRVTGTWTLDRPLDQWARVMVHMPDHGAHTQQARYEVDTGNGVRTRVVLQRTLANRWVSLGVFRFSGTPRVRLSSETYDGDNGALGRPVEGEDIAFDAVAFQPLAAKPANVVVSLGDSYSSGEGASRSGGLDYYPETDNNGDKPLARNACHRSPYAWSRLGTLAGDARPIGQRSDSWDPALEHSLLACSGAQTENLLPVTTATGPPPRNAWGDPGQGQWGELSQLDRGFLDEHTTLVTLSIGGNDARFSDVFTHCVLTVSGICPDTVLAPDTDPLRVAAPRLIADRLVPSVVTVLREVRAKAPNARIVLMGYPALLERGGQCVPGIGVPEAEWLNGVADVMAAELDRAVREARAVGVDAVFADPRADFRGSAVCGDPAVVHGVLLAYVKTPGQPTGLDPITAQETFHPTIDGQRRYAATFDRALRGLGL